MKIARLLIIFLSFEVSIASALLMPPKKIELRKPELRSADELTLKERVLVSLMQVHGTNCMALLKGPVDLINFNDLYVERCCQDMQDYAMIARLSRVPKDPPAAAPLSMMIQHAHSKKRFDILRIIVDEYYAAKQWPALCLLARGGYTKACNILLGLKYVDPNCVDHLSHTPLMNAAITGKTEVVELLLKRKDLDISRQNRCKKDSCQLARENKHQSVVLLLEEALQNKKHES